MNTKENKHVIDILFVVALFSLFVLSAIFIISIGANIYSKTMKNMDNNFSSRTAAAYILEKIHQSDCDGNVRIDDFADIKAIAIYQTINDTDYITYIYEYDGSIREVTKRADLELSPSSGQEILEVSSFNIEETSDGLFKCVIAMEDEESYTFYAAIHTEDIDNGV